MNKNINNNQQQEENIELGLISEFLIAELEIDEIEEQVEKLRSRIKKLIKRAQKKREAKKDDSSLQRQIANLKLEEEEKLLEAKKLAEKVSQLTLALESQK